MLEDLETKIQGFKPEDFLTSNDNVSTKSLYILKSLYDFTKSEEKTSENLKKFVEARTTSRAPGKKKRSSKFQLSKTELPLDNLIIKSFDSDQVWEELQLQNTLIYETLISSVSKILARDKQATIAAQQRLEDSSDSYQKKKIGGSKRLSKSAAYTVQGSDSEGDSDESDEVEFEGRKTKAKSKKSENQLGKVVYEKSILDAGFFNLAQMHEYEEKIEALMNKRGDDQESESDEDEDDEGQEEDDQENENYFYSDYFDRPIDFEDDSGRRNNEENEDGDDDDAEGSENENEDQNESEEDDDDEDPNQVPLGNKRTLAKDNKEDKTVRFLLDDEEVKKDEAIDSLPENESNFEKRRKKIEEGIELMEKEALEPKAWQFQGEITADKRPENSLLEEHVMFDHLIRQAPEITAETTLRLEDIIKQRIKDQAWDDVIRKVKPVENPVEYKKKLVLDSEKSRVGLAKIYEEEYIKKKQVEEGQAEEEVPEEQIQIEKDLKALFSKLDALSNFHYTPKPPSAEIRIVTNLPSIAFEEVAPVAVSDATLLAPQEIQDPTQGEIKGKAERTDTDKKRERRIKKKKQHVKRIAREEKARAKGITLEHVTYADKKLKKSKSKTGEDEGFHNSKELKSSKAFFSRLQQEAQSQIKGTLAIKRKKDSSQLVAKKFKL